VSDINQTLTTTRKKAVLVIVGLSLLLGFLDIFHIRHGKSPAEEAFLFYGILGFGAFLTVVIGGVLLRKLIIRAEDYYDAD